MHLPQSQSQSQSQPQPQPQSQSTSTSTSTNAVIITNTHITIQISDPSRPSPLDSQLAVRISPTNSRHTTASAPQRTAQATIFPSPLHPNPTHHTTPHHTIHLPIDPVHIAPRPSYPIPSHHANKQIPCTPQHIISHHRTCPWAIRAESSRFTNDDGIADRGGPHYTTLQYTMYALCRLRMPRWTENFGNADAGDMRWKENSRTQAQYADMMKIKASE